MGTGSRRGDGLCTGQIYVTGEVCNQVLWSASIAELYPMCGRLSVGKGFLGGFAVVVGAAMCSAS